ncbi:MAG: glycosyltransferase family 2 protein [Nitrospirae bacterium]|nr:glycosyltransferase family 2 protein [Nitrospirota bacterium]
MKLKTSIIIPTYNRPVDLNNCIESILIQTQLPYEILIIDDGNLPEPPLKAQCEELGIKYVYFKKDKPGSSASRNKGIELSTGDILFFLDDDVVLFPDYIERIMDIYNNAGASENIGGVGGAIANHKKLGPIQKLRKILEISFMAAGLREGKVLPSGFCNGFGTTPFKINKITEVDFLSGGVSSFKKEVFNKFAFDPKYFPFTGEDMDFSYRVSKAYKLIFTPLAQLYHYEAPKMRPDAYKQGFMFTVFVYRFFKMNVKKNPLQWVFFYYAFLGYILSRLLICIVSPKKQNVDKLRGVFGAFDEVIFHGKQVIM